ncbi:outer membrane protein [Hansschlegelia beijingensis]|uniref:outer membrane protein n=1 Tax=Hansschlegelia beijingensis TaxID=1133344 RepID=UPI00387F2D59
MSLLIRSALTASLLWTPSQLQAWERTEASSPRSPSAATWLSLRALDSLITGSTPDLSGPRTAFDRIVVGVGGGSIPAGADARFADSLAEGRISSAIEARIGYAFGRFVAYGAAGLASASAEFARSGQGRSAVAWRLGGGLEAQLLDGVTARLEYLYVDLGRRRSEGNGEAGLAPAGGQVTAGLNYRF